MKAIEFEAWIEAFDRLNNGQMDKLREKFQKWENSDKGLELTEESFPEKIVCPHCASTEKPYRWGRSCNLPRYRCRNCNRTFNALTNTPLAGLPHKGKLLNYEQAMNQGRVKKIGAGRGVAILSGDSIICMHPHYPAK